MKPPKTFVVIASLGVTFAFAALEVTADELYGFAQANGSHFLYYFPLIGPYDPWPAWTMVFSGLGLMFFTAWILGYSFHAATLETPPAQPPVRTLILREPGYWPSTKPGVYDLPDVPGVYDVPDVPRGTQTPTTESTPATPATPVLTKPLGLEDL